MEFSDDWRSLWPIAAVFSPPKSTNIAGNVVGPLIFAPSGDHRRIFSSNSLALRLDSPAPAAAHVDAVRSFFSVAQNAAFIPSDAAEALAVGAAAAASNPIPFNNLAFLRCRRGLDRSLLLFFPIGENAESIGYVSVCFGEESIAPEVVVDRDGDVFKQVDGFKHASHRILKLSAVAAALPYEKLWSPEVEREVVGEDLVEGFVLAASLYAVNWFKVEIRLLDSGYERPVLVPWANQVFDSSVMDACWSSDFVEESSVLLESGDLCWFNLNSKRCRIVRICLGGDKCGQWLSCEFGGRPMTVLVACSEAVILVDLNGPKGGECKVLVKAEMLSLFNMSPMAEPHDKILAFCKASFSDRYISVVTEHQLHLFDPWKSKLPILTWDHSLKSPGYVRMFRLSELRSLEEFKWATQSGVVILVGSFWNDKFSLFCCGPPKEEALNFGSSLYAWSLPSTLSLSGLQCGSGDKLITNTFLEEDVLNYSKWHQLRSIVTCFVIVPNDLLGANSQSSDFVLIRLTLSGKLEVQGYRASTKMPTEDSYYKGEDKSEIIYPIKSSEAQEGKLSRRCDFFRLWHLKQYLKGNLSDALSKYNNVSSPEGKCQVSFSQDMEKLISCTLNSSKLPALSFITDVSIPTSVFEITCRRILTSLQPSLLPFAFSKYSDLFQNSRNSSFEFLELPICLPHNKTVPFFLTRPTSRSERSSTKELHNEALVGPVLPIPVLLTLQQNDEKDNSSAIDKELVGCDDDFLKQQCRVVLENVIPELFVTDIGNCNGWNDSVKKQDEKYFVYEPSQICSSTINRTNDANNIVKQELSGSKQMEPSFASFKDENFSNFVCGIADKKGASDASQELLDHENLNFEISPIKLDFDSTEIVFQLPEQKIFKCLKRQFSKWQENYKPYQDFCTSHKIPKLS